MQSGNSLTAFFLIYTGARDYKCMEQSSFLPLLLHYATAHLFSLILKLQLLFMMCSLLFTLSKEMNMYCL